jgi:hypothetical protein
MAVTLLCEHSFKFSEALAQMLANKFVGAKDKEVSKGIWITWHSSKP